MNYITINCTKTTFIGSCEVTTFSFQFIVEVVSVLLYCLKDMNVICCPELLDWVMQACLLLYLAGRLGKELSKPWMLYYLIIYILWVSSVEEEGGKEEK